MKFPHDKQKKLLDLWLAEDYDGYNALISRLNGIMKKRNTATTAAQVRKKSISAIEKSIQKSQTSIVMDLSEENEKEARRLLDVIMKALDDLKKVTK